MKPNELAILRRLWNVGPTHRDRFNPDQLVSLSALVAREFIDVDDGGMVGVSEAGLLALVAHYLSIPPANPSPPGTVLLTIDAQRKARVA